MHRSLLILLACGSVISACSDTTLGTKSFEETLDPISVPGGPVSLGMLSLPEFSFPLNLKDQDGYELLDNVTSVNARSATMSVSPDSDSVQLDQFADNNPDNFDFLSSMTLSLRATFDGTVQTIQVASIPEGDPQIGSNSSTIDLVMDDVDIRDFVEAPDVELVVLVSGTNPQDFVIIDTDLRFRVGLGVR